MTSLTAVQTVSQVRKGNKLALVFNVIRNAVVDSLYDHMPYYQLCDNPYPLTMVIAYCILYDQIKCIH